MKRLSKFLLHCCCLTRHFLLRIWRMQGLPSMPGPPLTGEILLSRKINWFSLMAIIISSMPKRRGLQGGSIQLLNQEEESSSLPQKARLQTRESEPEELLETTSSILTMNQRWRYRGRPHQKDLQRESVNLPLRNLNFTLIMSRFLIFHHRCQPFRQITPKL